jgi:hypothetical protein
MHQTITGILWNKREIEASSMGIGTLRGYNLYQPPDCNPQTRNHKQASIFVELADAFRLSETARASGQPASTAAARSHVLERENARGAPTMCTATQVRSLGPSQLAQGAMPALAAALYYQMVCYQMRAPPRSSARGSRAPRASRGHALQILSTCQCVLIIFTIRYPRLVEAYWC